ncbi:MAG: hypothetical protein HYY48_01490 [Gammaproteobacteria bacterium]|nr:hypothetical protein [Gammaproteobacteria bacterium]
MAKQAKKHTTTKRPLKLSLSIAVGDYDRTRPLVDGSVRIDGVDPNFMLLSPEEMFFRAFRHADFDVAELSLSSFTLRAARRLLGQDFWSYGLNDSNRKTLDTFLRHHHAQGLSPRRVAVEELFHPAAFEIYKI